MASQSHDNDPEVARTKLLQLLRADEWELTDGTRERGKAALRWLRNREPTEIEMVDYVISLLEDNAHLRCAPQDDPAEIAWQMTDRRNVFFKLVIREHRIGQEYAYIKSIHDSDYAP